MQISWDLIQKNAVRFSKRWKDACNEEAEAQPFEMDFLRVFGVPDPARAGDFEFKVRREDGTKGYIDYLWKRQIAIEIKSRGKDLASAFDQLRDYLRFLPEDEIPDLWMVSDFENIRLCRRSTNEEFSFKTKFLHKHIRRFANIAGYTVGRARDGQLEVNVRAAEKMARLHDALKAHGYEGHVLRVYLVRLLFCLFADDTGIFPQDTLYGYIENSKPDGSDLSHRIANLFEVLNMPEEIRAKKALLSEELKQFRYINGGLFLDRLPPADFDAKMRKTLIDCMNFDWSKISPAIFGAMFQGVMDKGQRRELGAHYTSAENILKLINPLFMDDLWKEFERVKTDPKAILIFHDKIARLKFLDPACGCGNFLIVTYRQLRLLEIEILKMQRGSTQRFLDISGLLKVSVEQFYGIECEDFPCQIAQAGMWLIDHQMNILVSEEFGSYYMRLPLTQSATIVNSNALRTGWESVVPKEELSYIMGNPPFNGYSNQSAEQKEDILSVCLDATGKPIKSAGKIDYVSAWYYKTAKFLTETRIRAAFVSTNSITQGEQAASVWKPLFEMFGIHIDFARRTFKWSNEAKGKAAVHCVIVGFSVKHNGEKIIYNGEERIAAKNINPYLVDAPNIFVGSRAGTICDIPAMKTGNRPADGGHLIIEDADLPGFLKSEPTSEKYIRRFLGSEEFINDKKRWCLWLVGVSPEELRHMPEVMKRIAACRADRKNSPDEGRRKLADTPALFRETNNPESYLVVPSVSSERRHYIPIGFMSSDVIVGNSNLMIPDATLYHFGILTSGVHMAWTRAVCGRLKSDYRYSKDIVYNNFPWPDASDEQKSVIEKLAQTVLDARGRYPDSSLADLYDPLTMPPELFKAHRNLDNAVMKLYGLSAKDTTEAACVTALLERYQGLTSGKRDDRS